MKRSLITIVVTWCLLLCAGAAAMADLQVAGFPLRVSGQTSGLTRAGTVKIPFADKPEQAVWVDLDEQQQGVVAGRLGGALSLQAGAFTVDMDAAWYDPESKCFTGTGTLTGEGLPVPLHVQEVTFDAGGVRAVKGLKVEKNWLVGGVVFAPDEGRWDGPSLHFEGRMAERPYPQVEVTVERGQVALRGPLQPITVLVRGAPVTLTGLDVQGGTLVASGTYPGAKAMVGFSGVPLAAESLERLPVRSLPSEPVPPFPRATFQVGGDEVHDDPQIPGLRRFEAHWGRRGLLTCQMSSGVPTSRRQGEDGADTTAVVPTGFIPLAPPLGRVSVAGAPVTEAGQLQLAYPGVRFFWEQRYANVSQIYPPLLERVFPVELGDDVRFVTKQACFDGTSHPMIGSSIKPVKEALTILGMAATPNRVWADAHEADFHFTVAGGQDVEFTKFWFVHFFMRTEQPFDVIMAEFANGEKGFAIGDKLKGLQIWLKIWDFRITVLNFKDFELPFVLRYGSNGYTEMRTRAQGTFSNLFGMFSIKNPSMTMLYAPVNSILQNMRCRYGADEISVFALATIEEVVIDFVAFGPRYLGFYGHGLVTVSAGWFLDWILELPDRAPLDIWFGLTEDYPKFRGLAQLRAKVGVKLIHVDARDPVAWVPITPETLQSKEPIFDAYMKVDIAFLTRVLNIWSYLDGRSDWRLNSGDEPIPIPNPKPVPGPDDPLRWDARFQAWGLSFPAHFSLLRTQGTMEARIYSEDCRLEASDGSGNQVKGRLSIVKQERNYDVTSNGLVPGAQVLGNVAVSLASRVHPGMKVYSVLQGAVLTVHHGGELTIDRTVYVPTEHGKARLDLILHDRRRKGTLLAHVTYEDGRVDDFYFPLSAEAAP